jgi:hypothetical protein
MSPRAQQGQESISRRHFLGLIVAGGAAIYLADRYDVGPFADDDHHEAVAPPSSSEAIGFDDVEGVKKRAEQLEKHSEQELAAYLLEAKHVSFDDKFPRVRESMTWAAKSGAFPLVNPEGDINKGLDDCSPNVPAQKPLLVTLALLNDAGIDFTINSLATSSDHMPTSHHYMGRGCDIAQDDNTVTVMRFIHNLNKEGIVAVDDLFAPGNPEGLGLNDGKAGVGNEGNHLHFSTQPAEHVKEVYQDPADAVLFPAQHIEGLIKSELGIDISTYFNIDRDKADKLIAIESEAYKTHKIAEGIFPPSVMQWKKEIERASKHYHVPANLIASLITIETCGIASASSAASANGVMQVVPSAHGARIDKISGRDFKNDDERAEYLREHPEKCIMIGTSYLAELFESARKVHSDLDPYHPAVYARVAAGYNGGPNKIKQDFSQWPLESQKYANFASAFYVDACVSNVLTVKGGLDEAEKVTAAMQSPAMVGRMRTFRALGPLGNDVPYKTYSDRYRALEQAHPGVTDDEVTNWPARTAYNLLAAGYDNDSVSAVRTRVTTGLTPGLAFWTAHGGYSSFNADPANVAWAAEAAK